MLWILACEVYKLDLIIVPQVGQVLSKGRLQNQLIGDEDVE